MALKTYERVYKVFTAPHTWVRRSKDRPPTGYCCNCCRVQTTMVCVCVLNSILTPMGCFLLLYGQVEVWFGLFLTLCVISAFRIMLHAFVSGVCLYLLPVVIIQGFQFFFWLYQPANFWYNRRIEHLIVKRHRLMEPYVPPEFGADDIRYILLTCLALIELIFEKVAYDTITAIKEQKIGEQFMAPNLLQRRYGTPCVRLSLQFDTDTPYTRRRNALKTHKQYGVLPAAIHRSPATIEKTTRNAVLAGPQLCELKSMLELKEKSRRISSGAQRK